MKKTVYQGPGLLEEHGDMDYRAWDFRPFGQSKAARVTRIAKHLKNLNGWKRFDPKHYWFKMPHAKWNRMWVEEAVNLVNEGFVSGAKIKFTMGSDERYVTYY